MGDCGERVRAHSAKRTSERAEKSRDEREETRRKRDEKKERREEGMTSAPGNRLGERQGRNTVVCSAVCFRPNISSE